MKLAFQSGIDVGSIGQGARNDLWHVQAQATHSEASRSSQRRNYARLKESIITGNRDTRCATRGIAVVVHVESIDGLCVRHLQMRNNVITQVIGNTGEGLISLKPR